MQFTSEQRLDDGVLERDFILGEIPGVLWTSGSSPAPLILSGHNGGLHKRLPRLVARARHYAAEYGFDELDAYMLLSQAGRIRLGNMVDPKYTLGASILKKYLVV